MNINARDDRFVHTRFGSRLGKPRISRGKPSEKSFRVSVNRRENKSCEYPRTNILHSANINPRTISRQGQGNSKRTSHSTDPQTSLGILERYTSPRINFPKCSRAVILQRCLIEDDWIRSYSPRGILEKYPVKDYSIRNNNFIAIERTSSGGILSRTNLFAATFSKDVSFDSGLSFYFSRHPRAISCQGPFDSG